MSTQPGRIDARYTHAVVFIGPPYGPTDGGRVVSLHANGHGADHAYDRLAATGGVHDRVVVALDEPYWRDRHGRTAREHFAG
jgi:hypothetical protein